MTLCKQCGASVSWVMIEARWHCHNADGTDHWDLCSKLRWEQTKATGVRFDRLREAGYANSVHGTKFERLNAKIRRGSRYKSDRSCGHCVPAWDVCPNHCPIALGCKNRGAR